jgi:class 3 adenylate cyclase
MARSSQNVEEIFPKEAAVVQEMTSFLLNAENKEPDEINGQFEKLLLEYQKLLKLTAKITSLGDSAHSKMERMQEELQSTLDLLQIEQQKSESLLHNILPVPIARRMQNAEHSIADRFESVTVLFADIAGFTNMASRSSPDEIVRLLDTIFSGFDSLLSQYGVEKIKTIGDCYMAVAGMPEKCDDHAERAAKLALAMIEQIQQHPFNVNKEVNIRIGLNSGEVVAGVIGKVKFAYDLWGDTVNTASRMESSGVTGAVHCSSSTYGLLKDRYTFESRGMLEIKGKGTLQTWLLKP